MIIKYKQLFIICFRNYSTQNAKLCRSENKKGADVAPKLIKLIYLMVVGNSRNRLVTRLADSEFRGVRTTELLIYL